MKFLSLYVALCFISTIVVAESGDGETTEKSQNDGTELPTTNEDVKQPLGKDAKLQQQPLPLQNNVPNYPALSQLEMNYLNRRRPLLYPANGAGQMVYRNPQPVAMYQNYPTQSYAPYSYGYGQRRQPNTWNSPTEPLLGTNYWESATAKPKQQISPQKVPQSYNQQYWGAPVRAPKMDPTWYPISRQPVYYGRRPIRRRPYQPPVRNGWYPQPILPTPKPKPIKPAFDPTSEQHFLAEYSTGSVQESDSGLQLISDEAEKGKEGNIRPAYPITRPAWPLPRPVVPQPTKPWNPRPDYVPNPRPDYVPNPRPDYVPSTETPDKAIKDKRLCYMNCRRRCNLGYGNFMGKIMGCGGSRPYYRTNGNGGNWRYRNNGQYWGAAAQWNNGPNIEQGQTLEELNNPSQEVAEEKPCGPELPNSGQWKWIENNWKWVCKDEAPAEETIIDA